VPKIRALPAGSSKQAQSRGNQMRCVSVCVLAAAAAVLSAGVARARSQVEPAGSGFGASPTSPPLKMHGSPSRAGTFAAASIATARRMAPEQREEWRFLKEAAAASRFESEASRMALAKSNNAQVRAFAATLINDHASTSITLQHMLHGRGMAPPMLANDQRKTLNRLTKLGGARFDREYMDEVGLRYQQEDLQVWEKAGLAIRDPALRAWIARTLPTLRYHLSTAQRIASTEDAKPVRAAASRKRRHMAPTLRQAAAQPEALSQQPFDSRAAPASQLMGAAPMQLGVTQPVAAWPIESNSR
jgi:predicted outer membrane protein